MNVKDAAADEEQFTPGWLPAAAFSHPEPTAVGTVDLHCPDSPGITKSLHGELRDALLLVRLHRDPLGMVHVPADLIDAGDERILALVDEQLGPRIRRHLHHFGCRMQDASCPGDAPPHLHGNVAVIVATTGRLAMLDRSLQSLSALAHDHLEIIVVDNRPAAQTRELVMHWRARDSRVRYVAEPRAGLSVARNRGIAETQAEFVAFTDDDAVVDPGWLAWLLAPFADPAVAAATGMVLPLELETVAQKRFEQYAGFCKGFDRRVYDLRCNRADDRLLYPYWGGFLGSGNSMAFRRAELIAAGGFDPGLPGAEDIDAMSRAILRGGQLVYEPRSLCWHEHRRDQEAFRRQLFNYGAHLTAMLTKALTHDPRFVRAAIRSIPLVFEIRRRSKRQAGSAAVLPPELAKIERAGMLRGPMLYAQTLMSARRLRLDEVINGG
jgi:GT2 family glycosyltransferase